MLGRRAFLDRSLRDFTSTCVYPAATPGSFTLYVPSATLEPESEFVIDIRTRLGFDLVGPKLALFCDAQSGGQ